MKQDVPNDSDLKRREKGKKVVKQLQGDGGLDEIMTLMEEVFPDFLKITEERLFGDIWSRPGLSLRDRSMITLALLIENRWGDPTYVHFHNKLLKAHLRYALNSGLSKKEILEVMMHVANYTCWGAGHQAIRVAKDILATEEPQT